MAGQTQTLLQSLVAEGLARTSGGGYQTALYVGRGITDGWIVPGQTIAADNLTSAYDVRSGRRSTYGMRITVGGRAGGRVVRIRLTGSVPGQDVKIQLPVFASAGVKAVAGGSYDAATHTVTMDRPDRGTEVTLGDSARPALRVTVASTVPGQHTQPALVSGAPTTASATVTNPGRTPMTGVRLAIHAPQGWVSTATSPATFASIGPGQTETVTWKVTPAPDANGGAGLVVTAAYDAPYDASGQASAEQWVRVQRPLPLLPGSTDVALSATPSASYTSPWEHVTAINDGIYPTSSNDSQDIRWGCWPQTGTQWIELDWSQPVSRSTAAPSISWTTAVACACRRRGRCSTGPAPHSPTCPARAATSSPITCSTPSRSARSLPPGCASSCRAARDRWASSSGWPTAPSAPRKSSCTGQPSGVGRQDREAATLQRCDGPEMTLIKRQQIRRFIPLREDHDGRVSQAYFQIPITLSDRRRAGHVTRPEISQPVDAGGNVPEHIQFAHRPGPAEDQVVELGQDEWRQDQRLRAAAEDLEYLTLMRLVGTVGGDQAAGVAPITGRAALVRRSRRSSRRPRAA